MIALSYIDARRHAQTKATYVQRRAKFWALGDTPFILLYTYELDPCVELSSAYCIIAHLKSQRYYTSDERERENMEML